MPPATEEPQAQDLFADIGKEQGDTQDLFADIGEDIRPTPVFTMPTPPPAAREAPLPFTQAAATEDAAIRQFMAREEKRSRLSAERFGLEKEIEAQAEPSLLEKGAAKGIELISKPLKKIAPTEDIGPAVERFLTLASPTMTAALARGRAVGGEPLPNIIPPETHKAIQIASGVTESLANTVNFFTSPLGIATLGMGMLPKAVHAAIAMAFAVQMARAVPEIAKQLGDELGQPEEKRDYKKIAALTTEAVTATGFAIGGARGAYRTAMQIPGIEVLEAEKRMDVASRLRAERTAEEIATFPGLGRRQFAPGLEAPPPGDIIQAERGPLPIPAPAVTPPTPGFITTTLPEKGPWEAYHKNFFRMVDELRQRGNPNMTRNEIRTMFPEIFGKLEGGSERAAVLARQAWGEGWKPTAPEVRARAEAALPEAVIEPKITPTPPPVTPPPPPEPVPPTPAPTPTTPRSPHDFEPALLVDDVPMVGGDDHEAIFKRLKEEALAKGDTDRVIKLIDIFSKDATHIFVDKEKNRYTRIEAGKALGLDAPLQSSELLRMKGRKPTEAPPPPPDVHGILDPREYPLRYADSTEIVVQPDLMQFKRTLAGDKRGVTAEHKKNIAGKWDEAKAGLILVWEPIDKAKYGLTGDQKYIVANGHGRFNYGIDRGISKFNIQIMREADGYSASDARTKGALVNIAEGKGTLYDQALFLRTLSETHGEDATLERARQEGVAGRDAATLAFSATNETFESFRNGILTDEQALAIAKAAPKNEAGQLLGRRFARKVKDPDSLAALIEHTLKEKGAASDQLDLFGQDDSAINKAIADQKKAEAIMDALRNRINSMRSAKRAELAQEEGIDIKDPAAVVKRMGELQAELERWKQWWLHPDLVERITGKPPVSAPPPAPAPAPPAPKPGEPPPPAPAPAPSPEPAPSPAPPAAPVVDKPTLDVFGDQKAKDAEARLRDRLKGKQPPTPPPQPPPDVSEPPGGIRMAAEAPQAELFPGETPETEDPLFIEAILRDLTDVGGNLIAHGNLDYSSWYREMHARFPELRHYFRRAYNQVRDVSSLRDLAKRMTPREEVELYNDEGIKIGKGSKHRPGLRVINEDLIPQAPQVVSPGMFVGPEGDSPDWTQCLFVNLALEAHRTGKKGVMAADGPGVGKTGIGALLGHMLTKPTRIPLAEDMTRRWNEGTDQERARWLGTPGIKGIDKSLTFDKLTPEEKQQVYQNAGYSKLQIAQDNINADKPADGEVLVIGTSKPHLDTTFIPDFKKLGIPLENIDFATYSVLSIGASSPEGRPTRILYDKITSKQYKAVIFDEAHAFKNAGSGREHNSRKIKAPFKVFMTATPMDNRQNAIYFMSEITGKTRWQIMDQLGLKRVVQMVNGEEREFIVQKEGISDEDVKAALFRLREQAIKDGLMIRREFPWWGDVVGKERDVKLDQAAALRWRFAGTQQRLAWLEPPPSAMRYGEGGEMPSYREPIGGVMAVSPAPRGQFPAEGISRPPDPRLEWDKLNPEERERVLFRMFSESEKAKGSVRMAVPGVYETEPLSQGQIGDQQRIYDNWDKLIKKVRNPLARRNFGMLRSQELARWLESTKGPEVLDLIQNELKAGRNVVVYANNIHETFIKGLDDGLGDLPKGQKVRDFKGVPVQGVLGFLEKKLRELNIPFAPIFGAGDKSGAIRDFYGNRVRVALVTPESGAAGLNLDDVIGRYPRTLVVVGIPWKGDAFEQLMYRVSRRNTASESKAHILITPGGFADHNLRGKMNKKLRVLRGIQAGEDTDLTSFLDDMNNPEREFDEGPDNAADIISKGPLPKLQWQEVRGRTGRIRYRAPATAEFNVWWEANGENNNPMGWRVTTYDWQKWVWADQLPDERLYKEPPPPPPGVQALGGYYDDLPNVGQSPQSISDEIGWREEAARAGTAGPDNSEHLVNLHREQTRLRGIDERVNAILADDSEFQRLTEMLDENPGHPLWNQWENARHELAQDIRQEVTTRLPEPQQATASTATVPSSAAPAGLRAPTRSIDQIQRILQRGLGVKIFYGSQLGGGFFDPLHQYVRIKRVGDFPGITHEGGHVLDDTWKFSSMAPLAFELDFLGDNNRPGSRSSWRPGMSQAYKFGEGMAEFVRYWVTIPAYVTQHAPKMLARWEQVLDSNPELSFMRTVKNDYQTFLASDPQMRLRSRVVTEGDPLRQPFKLGRIVEGLIDDLHFLRLASDDAWKATGGLKPHQDPYALFRLLRGTYGRAETFIRTGIVDAKTGDVKPGTSLMHALEPVSGRMADFRDWIVAKRAEELFNRTPSIDSGIPRDEWRAVIRRFAFDKEFPEAFKKVLAWEDAVLQYAVDLGYKTVDEAKLMRAVNKAYVPFHRLYEVGINEPLGLGTGTGRKLAMIGTPGSLRRLRGSERPILDPIASMIENAYSVVFAAEKNRALMALADLSGLPDMGKWIIPDKRHVEPVKFDISRIRQQLIDMGIDADTIPDHALLTFWRDSRRNPLPDNTIRVKRGNSLEYYKLDTDLYRAVNASDQFTLHGIWRWLAWPSQLLRAGVTEDPAFVYRNIIRDSVSAAVISRFTVFPFEAAIRGAYALLAPKIAERLGFKTHADLLRSIVAEWKAAGGKHAVETAYYDRERMQKFIRDQITRDFTWAQRGLYWASSPLMALRMLTQTGEEMTRIGEYWKVFNAALKRGESRMDAHLLAAFESRDLQDFAMNGSKTKPLKLLTAFWNAAWQGRYRFYRSLVDPRNPDIWKSTLLKGFGFITLAKMIEQYTNWDNEDYWAQPRWQRSIAFHIPIGQDKLGHTRFLLVPVPFEAGFIFATIPGLMMDYIKQRDVSAAEAFGTQFAAQMLDNPVPQPVMAVLESLPTMGWDYFQGKPIVPSSLSRAPYWSRYTDQTSLVAKKIGQMFPGEGVSPAKIEHYVRSTTGGIGTQVMHQLVDPMLSKAIGEPTAAAPVVPWRSFISPPQGTRSQIMDDFYQKLTALEHEAYARKHLKTKNEGINLGPLSEMLIAERNIAKLRQQLHGLSDADKREAITVKMERIARKFVRSPEGRYKGIVVKRFAPSSTPP